MMQLLEVKNDIAKIIYNPSENKLLPSDFLMIDDFNQKLVGQVLSVYTTENSGDNFADVRLALYIDKDEKLSYYNGYIPPRSAKIIYVTVDEITEMIADSDVNIYLGNLTYHPKTLVKTPLSLVDERLYIQCDREDNRKTIMQNIVSELYIKQKKVVLLDFDGRYNRISNVPRLIVSDSFKFPLNSDAFDIILDYDLVECPLEDKAVIQSIVLELKDYIKTLDNKFLPFTLFKNVVVSEFSSNPISGLMVLRNRLWQYAQDGLFAESRADFKIINKILENENIVIVDASKIEDKWHKFIIQTIPEILDRNCYFAISMNDIKMDKRAVLSLYNNPNIVPIVSTSYDSPLREILKSLSKNQILFKPSKQTEVDEQYGTLIHKLSSDDFILFGTSSLNLPLIIELKPFDIKTSEKIEEQEIRRNVDKILSTGKSMLPKEAVISQNSENEFIQSGKYTVDEDFNDEDLDFIDNIKKENISIEDLRGTVPKEEKKYEYDLFSPLQEEPTAPLSQEESHQTVDNSQENVMQFNIDKLMSYEERPDEILVSNENEMSSVPERITNNEEVKTNIQIDNEVVLEAEQTEEFDNIPNLPLLDNYRKSDENEIQSGLGINTGNTLLIDELAEEENNSFEGDIIEEENEQREEITEEQQIVESEQFSDGVDTAEKCDTGLETYEEIVEAPQEETINEEPVELTEEPEEQENVQITEAPQEEIQEKAQEEIKEEIQEEQSEEPHEGAEKEEETETETETKTEESRIEADIAETAPETVPEIISETAPETEEEQEQAPSFDEVLKQDEQKLENILTQEEDEENAPVEQQEMPKKRTKTKKNNEEIVPINSIIENIKSKVKNSVKNKSEKQKEEQEGKRERKVTKNTPPLPAEITNKKRKKELTAYETDTPAEILTEDSIPFKVGDKVYHPKHGKGVVEGFANYSNKILFCQIEFENVGRRILDPRISGIEKI